MRRHLAVSQHVPTGDNRNPLASSARQQLSGVEGYHCFITFILHHTQPGDHHVCPQ